MYKVDVVKSALHQLDYLYLFHNAPKEFETDTCSIFSFSFRLPNFLFFFLSFHFLDLFSSMPFFRIAAGHSKFPQLK